LGIDSPVAFRRTPGPGEHMAESIFFLTIAGVLLVAVPQFVSWAVAAHAFRSGRWWPVLLSVPLAALCFVGLATGLYSPDSATALQGSEAAGRIVVDRVGAGALAHAAAALIFQVGRLITGR
jgi:hypothetical protein